MKEKSFSSAARAKTIHPMQSDKGKDGSSPSQRHSAEQPARVAGQSAGDIIRALQKSYGNRYVQRMLALNSKGNGTPEVSAEVENAIRGAKGTGHALDSTARTGMEQAFGADFGGVRVHTGPQADMLGRSLNARAFTTGNDIFFRDGEYSPGRSDGRELLAHELTHVIQQGGGIKGKFSVSTPDDEQEKEADQVAREITQAPQKSAADDEDASA